MIMMFELEALRRISAYIAENKINSALEAEENMVVEPIKYKFWRETLLWLKSQSHQIKMKR